VWCSRQAYQKALSLPAGSSHVSEFQAKAAVNIGVLDYEQGSVTHQRHSSRASFLDFLVSSSRVLGPLLLTTSGRHVAARDRFREALALDPSHELARKNLDALNRALGQ
jgi:hypothetical protein